MTDQPADYTRVTRKFPASLTAKSVAEAVGATSEIAFKEYVNTQSLADPYANVYAIDVGGSLNVIEPPYNFQALARLPYDNSTLLACVHAMIANCDGHGHSFEYIGPDGQNESAEAKAEKALISMLFEQPNADYSWDELRARLRFDHETLGNSFMEVARDSNNAVTMMHHIPASTLRRTTRDLLPTICSVNLPRAGADNASITKRFARFVQIVNEKRIYFKEFGDPRIINSRTGQPDTSCPIAYRATEIIHRTVYFPTSPYGVPRWISQLPSIMGSRQAELTNYDFFKDNAIPAYVVMVSGGELTQETLDNIEDQFSAIKGRKSAHRMAFIEARGLDDAAPVNGQVPLPKIELKELRKDGADAMFQKYEQDCESKIRSSFRLPSLFVGLSEDHTQATAQTAYEIAEGQVFGPERSTFDDMVTKLILGSYQTKFWAFRSNAVRLTDNVALVAAVTAFTAAGAITPNTAIMLANQVFDTDMERITEEWGNWPMEFLTPLAAQGRLVGMENVFTEVDTATAGITAGGVGPDGKPITVQTPAAAPKTPAPAKKEEGPAIRFRPNPNADADDVANKANDRAFVAEALMALRDVLRPR